jgi:hypothetical protein
MVEIGLKAFIDNVANIANPSCPSMDSKGPWPRLQGRIAVPILPYHLRASARRASLSKSHTFHAVLVSHDVDLA